MEQIELQPMREEDVASTSSLAWSVFQKYVAPSFSEQGVEELKRIIRTDALLQRTNDGRQVFIAKTEDRIIGMIELGVRNDAIHIGLFFVDSSFQGKGVGKKLFYEGVKTYRLQFPEITEVTVNSSPNSVETYRSLGFQDAGSEKTENGIRYTPMRQTLCGINEPFPKEG